MLDQLRNSGTSIVNDRPAGETATILVVGAPRSGTSMVAATLDALGVYLGSLTDKAVYEDLQLANAMEQNGDVSGVIRQYNAAHKVWGFKRPMAFSAIDRFLPLFRNPRFVITFRDPVAIAKREEISMVSDFRGQLRRAAELNLELVRFIDRLTVPAMLVSYEKALLDAPLFASSLASFCGLNPSGDALARAAASISNGPELYLKSSQVRFKL